MTAAPSIAFAFASSAEAGVHGADLAAPGAAAVRAEVGMAGALPTLLVGGSTGVSDRVDLGASAVTHAGLAFAVGGTVRWRVADALGVGLGVDESLYTVESLAGIESLRAPFGNRLAVTPQLLASPAGRGDLALAAGAAIGVLRLEQGPEAVERALRPAVDDVWGEVAASFPRERGAFFVRFRAIVPVAEPFHVLGYVPWVAVGRSWGLP
jgi:hypothetical protein